MFGLVNVAGYHPKMAARLLTDDWRWSESYTFSLRPDHTLSDEKQRAIAHEFGMTDVADLDTGRPDNPTDYSLGVTTTHAMLFYKLRLYGFDPRCIKASDKRSSASSL